MIEVTNTNDEWNTIKCTRKTTDAHSLSALTHPYISPICAKARSCRPYHIWGMLSYEVCFSGGALPSTIRLVMLTACSMSLPISPYQTPAKFVSAFAQGEKVRVACIYSEAFERLDKMFCSSVYDRDPLWCYRCTFRDSQSMSSGGKSRHGFCCWLVIEVGNLINDLHDWLVWSCLGNFVCRRRRAPMGMIFYTGSFQKTAYTMSCSRETDATTAASIWATSMIAALILSNKQALDSACSMLNTFLKTSKISGEALGD